MRLFSERKQGILVGGINTRPEDFSFKGSQAYEIGIRRGVVYWRNLDVPSLASKENQKPIRRFPFSPKNLSLVK